MAFFFFSSSSFKVCSGKWFTTNNCLFWSFALFFFSFLVCLSLRIMSLSSSSWFLLAERRLRGEKGRNKEKEVCMRINTGELGWWRDLKEVFQTLEMWSKLISRRRDSSRSFDGDSLDAPSQRHTHTHTLCVAGVNITMYTHPSRAETIGIFHDSPSTSQGWSSQRRRDASTTSPSMTQGNVASPDRTYAWLDLRSYTHGLTRGKAIVSFPNLFLCTTQWVKYDEMKRWYLVFQNISALHGAV